MTSLACLAIDVPAYLEVDLALSSVAVLFSPGSHLSSAAYSSAWRIPVFGMRTYN